MAGTNWGGILGSVTYVQYQSGDTRAATRWSEPDKGVVVTLPNRCIQVSKPQFEMQAANAHWARSDRPRHASNATD